MYLVKSSMSVGDQQSDHLVDHDTSGAGFSTCGDASL